MSAKKWPSALCKRGCLPPPLLYQLCNMQRFCTFCKAVFYFSYQAQVLLFLDYPWLIFHDSVSGESKCKKSKQKTLQICTLGMTKIHTHTHTYIIIYSYTTSMNIQYLVLFIKIPQVILILLILSQCLTVASPVSLSISSSKIHKSMKDVHKTVMWTMLSTLVVGKTFKTLHK